MSAFKTGGALVDELSDQANRIWDLVQQAQISGQSSNVSDQAIQNLMTAALKLYTAKIDESRVSFSPVRSNANITATEVAVLSVELMHVVNLNLFDLSMWASRPRE
jgi:hypothetical protein